MTQESQNANELPLPEAEAGAEPSLEAQAKASTDAQAAEHGQADTQLDEADEAQKKASTDAEMENLIENLPSADVDPQWSDRVWHGNLKQRGKVARSLSQTAFATGHYWGNAGNIAAMMEIANSMGINYVRAMQNIHVMTISGKVKIAVGGELLLKMVRDAGHLVGIKVEGEKKEDVVATCTIQRRLKDKDGVLQDDGEPHVETFSWQEAVAAGLTKGSKGDKPTYNSYPKIMVRWRAVSSACKFACSDCLYGLSFKEVLEDDILLQGSQTKGIMGAANTPKEPTPSERAENATKSDARVVPNGSKD